ncbi:hypothetical protein EJ03DRAFT_65562 [Teratosphaeria nubilosa]|uniref:F-box domain-containing protein n=1 Tax=Teratosphaeria nubilosa TaxID=161662 RepID=A0A6G1KSM1_9PEZI|nr:hypothetical protein EJ03DRAFT_65562 [Teratosphaeria nubilosa]
MSGEITFPVIRLPPELLRSIFECCNLRPHDLTKCILTCKIWHDIAQDVLYEHVALNHQNRTRFVGSRGPTTTNSKIQTLSLQIEDSARRHPYPVSTGTPATEQLWLDLELLSARMKSMTSLKSFSIFRPSCQSVPGFWISYGKLELLLKSLPPSCTSLELDVNASKAEGVHLCPSIRGVLPQLEHLRLRLPQLCPDFCGRGFNPSHPTTIAPTFVPMEAPRLKTLVVNTTLFLPAPGTQFCGALNDAFSNPVASEPSWSALASYLHSSRARGAMPMAQSVQVYSVRRSDRGDPASFTSYVRHDILLQQARSMPVRHIGVQKDGSVGWFARCSDEKTSDIMTVISGLSSVVESRMWRETMRGVRLPAALMSRSGLPARVIGMSRQQWQLEEGAACSLWHNEDLTGLTLLRVLDGNLLDQPVVKQFTPSGWELLRTDAHDLLFRIR